jgi:hypothetical protein
MLLHFLLAEEKGKRKELEDNEKEKSEWAGGTK